MRPRPRFADDGGPGIRMHATPSGPGGGRARSTSSATPLLSDHTARWPAARGVDFGSAASRLNIARDRLRCRRASGTTSHRPSDAPTLALTASGSGATVGDNDVTGSVYRGGRCPMGLLRSRRRHGRRVWKGRRLQHGQVDSPRDGGVEPGWAERTVDESFQIGVAGGLAIWQLAVLGALSVSEVSIPVQALWMAHLAVGGLAATLAIRRERVWPALLAVYALTVLDFGAVVDVDSALAYITIWGAILTTATPWLVAPTRCALPLAALSLSGVAAGMLVLHPDWGSNLLMATGARAVFISVAAGLAMFGSRRVVDDIAEREREFAAEYRELTVGRLAAQTAVEDARMLHDTVVNTLSAVAVGGALAADVNLVRQRCSADVRAVEAQLAGQDPNAFTPMVFTGDQHGIEVRWTGTIEDAERCFALLPPKARRALRGAVQELIRNAAKHSGADWVTVDLRHTGSTLTIDVSDDGRGFDGRLIPGRGLAESVRARSLDAGFDVAIRTSPDGGTSVVLTIGLERYAAEHQETTGQAPGASTGVERLRSSTRWLFSSLLILFGLVSAGIGRSGWPAGEYLMVALTGTLSLVIWALTRDGRYPPAWLAAPVVLTLPAAFLVGVAGVVFPSADAINWTAITLASALAALTAFRSRAPLLIAIGLELAAATTMYVVVPWTPHTAAIVLTGVAAQIGLFMGLVVIDPVIVHVGSRHELHQRASLKVGSERVATEIAARARARLTSAGLKDALDVLRSIGAGEVDPTDSHVRSRCATAERQLRQIISLSPQAPRMNPWLSLALTSACSKQVALTLQGCSEDAPDQTTAHVLGATIMSAVAATSPGSDLRVSLFRCGDHALTLLIVGATGNLVSVAPSTLPPGYTFTRQTVADLTLLELVTTARSRPAPVGAADVAPTQSPGPLDPA